MEKLQIRQEFGRSYIVRDYKVSGDNEYQISMITENHIEGVLECRISYEQEEKYLCYEVTNRISLDREFAERTMTFEDIKELFSGISSVMERANSFLLDSRFFDLDPEYIFKEMDSQNLLLLYFPASEDEKQDSNPILADFLLRKVDPNDESAVKIAYLFYKMVHLDTFSVGMFLNMIEKEEIIRTKETRPVEETKPVPKEHEENKEEAVNEERKVSYVYPIVFFAAGLILGIVYYIVRKEFLYSVYILMGACIAEIVMLVSLIKILSAVIARKREENIVMPDEEVSVEEYWGDDDVTQVFDDETVVFSEEPALDEMEIYRLEWQENHTDKKYRIFSFPVKIGKLSGSVDCRINDPSVSRIHAKMFLKDKKVYLTDLNSKNGSFVDGHRLLPGEEIPVDSNSVIRLGNLVLSILT